MEGITELVPFLVKEGDSKLWSGFLKTCQELKVFVKKPNECVPVINSLLNSSETRLYGLRLLAIFLKQSPETTISEHIGHWLQQSLKGVTQPSASLQSSVSFVVLCSLLEVSTRFPDVRKETSQLFVPRILETILEKHKESPQNSTLIIRCLYTCLLSYGKACGNYKDHLEKLLIKLLVSEPCTIHYVAKCFHLLAQCGPPGPESINYKVNWHSQHLRVVNSIHNILDQLFSDVNEVLGSFNLPVSVKSCLDIPSAKDDHSLLKAIKLKKIFSRLCKILECMLLDFFPTYKKIQPETILGVVCRSLAVTCKMLESNISNLTYCLMSQLCDVHLSALHLFNSLILCARTNLLPFSSLITKLFTQIFKWSYVDDWPHGSERPFSAVRSAGYKCLLTWLSVAKSCSFSEAQVNIIVDSIIKDIKCDKKIVSLNLEKNSGKNKSEKRASVGVSSSKLELNLDACLSGLSCIPLLLRIPISSFHVQNLQETVVRLLFEIQRMLSLDKNLPTPYASSKCRAELYSALLSLCLTPHPRFPPPLHYANILFNSASTDNDPEVSRICSHAVTSMTHMLRPCAPSFDLNEPLDSETFSINLESKQTEKEAKALSRRTHFDFLTLKSISCKNVNSNKNVNLNKKVRKNQTEFILPDDGILDKISIDLSPRGDIYEESQRDELIDLADSSSDESIILVESDGKSNHAVIDNKVNKCPAPKRSLRSNKEEEVTEAAMLESLNGEIKLNNSQVHKRPCASAEINTEESISKSSREHKTNQNSELTASSSDDLIIIESDPGIYIDETSLSRKAAKSVKSVSDEINSNSPSKSIKDISSNTTISQDMIIIDPPRYSLRSNKSCSSFSDKELSGINLITNDHVDDIITNAEDAVPSNGNQCIMIINDEDEPVTKKMRKSRKHREEVGEEAVLIAEEDQLNSVLTDDDSMLNSFVDSVPN